MGVQYERAAGCRRKPAMLGAHRNFWLFLLVTGCLTLGTPLSGHAVQRHTLLPEEGASGTQQGTGHAEVHPAAGAVQGVQEHSSQEGPAATPPAQHGAEPAPPQGSHTQPPESLPPLPGQPHQAPHAPEVQPEAPAPAHPAAPGGHGEAQPGHEAAPGEAPSSKSHGEAGGHGGEHGAALPQISPIPGVTFVETMIDLMDHELHGRTLGWRPNDLIIGRFTDDVNNYQLGVLEALRFTALRLKDSLTRMGDADTYDPDLEQALNLLMNRATLFWFPSAEASYSEAVDHLRIFLEKLKTGQRHFYYRKDNLVSLLSVYKDLLGNVNKSLIASNVSWFKTDDYFYYAKGVAHVYYEILRVVRVGFQTQLASIMNASDIMDEIIHELHRAEQIDPWISLDSDLDSLFANNRADLNAPLSEVAHLMGVLSQF